MPGAAQQTLMRQLVASGARLAYHGDFDWAGIRIGNFVMRELGAAGFPPLRSGVESVGMALPKGDDSDAVLERVKAALDPAGVLAGGKHGRE